MAAAVLAAPFVWRPLLHAWGPAQAALPPNYLPALEARRVRHPFDATKIESLQTIDPAYVIIGDSMAGRINFARLEELTGGAVAPLLQNATGSVYWYLAFKNWVVASGVHPKWVLVFFRDTNLTDPLFRIGDPAYFHLDEVATGREDELNAVLAKRVDPWFRVHQAVSDAYVADATRAWLEPKFGEWAANHAVAARRLRQPFTDKLNDLFALEHLRAMTAADMAVSEDRDADFAANVDSSVLPLFLSLARAHGLRVCFVRVLRRPEGGRPPAESAALSRYVRDMRRYIESHGGAFRDDRDDPVMATIEYADGDHIGHLERTRYTERFYATTPIFK